jgi:hypothetical protein
MDSDRTFNLSRQDLILMKHFVRFLVLIAALSVSDDSFAQQLPAGSELMVGYYGRPGSSALGVLGQSSIEELVPKVKANAAEYARVSGKQKVTPAFHLIYGLATGTPGRDKDYLLPLSREKVMEYIDAARSHGFAVIIDSQLGKLTPVEAVKPVLQYLKYDNVHLAIDPEFEVQGLDVRPGKVIGHISAEEVNQVQSAMVDYMRENGIAEDKILIVHSFTQHMLKDKRDVKKVDHVNLIFNLDGHGSPQLKVDIYNQLYTPEVSSKMAGGFKLFFREDKPSMMTPEQVLGLAPVGKTKIMEPPRYINYQ